MKNYCGILDHPIGCACTKEAQLNIEEQLKNGAAANQAQGTGSDEFWEELISIDYSIRRKVIYKGKIADPGHVYIVVNFKGKTHKYDACRMIPGNQSAEFEFSVAKELRQLLKEKYHV